METDINFGSLQNKTMIFNVSYIHISKNTGTIEHVSSKLFARHF